MNYEAWLKVLADTLVGLGVPPEQGALAALGLIYLVLTLLVVLVILLAVRRRRGARAGAAAPLPEAVEPPVHERPAADKTEVPVATPVAEAEVEPEVVTAVPPVEQAPAVEPADAAGLFGRLRLGLAKTRSSLVGRVDALLGSHARLDAAFLEELEEILITADFGMQATQEIVAALTKRLAGGQAPEQVRLALEEEVRGRLQQAEQALPEPTAGPLVLMVVGVNGVGKTTTIGKLARQYAAQGKKVVLGAGDTFRAAAAEQLEVWGERAGAEVIRQAEGTDPGAVAFDAAKAAVARKADVLIVDTAGRLHTKVNLMEELKKVRRILDREIPGAPHETLLVLDATTGQNALVQAKMFKEAVAVSGVVLTKLDGTAKGGIVVAIGSQLGLPVRFIGVGEGVDDLRPFDANEFVAALFQSP